MADNKNVAAATQNQALNALNFLYREVLTAPLGDVTQATRSKREPAIPVVLERREIKQLLSHLSGELADRTATLWRRASHYGVHTFTD